MRILILTLLPLWLLAQSYYARLEPDRTVTLSSTLSAEIVAIDYRQEGHIGTAGPLITFRSGVVEAEQHAAQLRYENLKRIVALRESRYDRNRRLSSISALELESEEAGLLQLRIELAQAKEHLARTEQMASGLRVSAQGLFVDRILVQKGAFVTTGTPLARLHDLSRARAVIFVPIAQAAELKAKEIIVDGQKSDFAIDKIWKVADSRHLSAYRVELVGPPPKEGFSQLIKIEFVPKETP